MLCPLAAMPKTFGLSVQDKGCFPHLYTKRDNLDKKLRYTPHRRFFQAEWMKPADKEKFDKWYRQQRVFDQQQHVSGTVRFNLKDKLIEYCSNDVRILTEASLQYREQFLRELGIEPFVAANTCAGLALNTYRAHHLLHDTMVHSPEGGLHRGFKASNIALRYIRCWEKINDLPPGSVQTDEWAIGEAPHPDDSGKRLDGLLFRNPPLRPLAIEFLGWYIFFYLLLIYFINV